MAAGGTGADIILLAKIISFVKMITGFVPHQNKGNEKRVIEMTIKVYHV